MTRLSYLAELETVQNQESSKNQTRQTEFQQTNQNIFEDLVKKFLTWIGINNSVPI